MKTLLWLLLSCATALAQPFPAPGISPNGGNASSANVTATGATTARTLAAQAADRLDVKAYGAKGDAIVVDASQLAGATMTAGSAALYSPSVTFTAADVGKAITIDGAGVAGGPLVTTISGFLDSHDITTYNAASTSVPTFYTTAAYPAVAQSGGGSYAPGDTATLTATGSVTAAVLKVTATTVVAVAANGAGSGGVNGACVLTGTTGVGVSGLGLFTVNATISGGAIASVGSIVNAGIYTTNPTSLTAEPVTGCSLVGGTVALTMGVNYANVATAGAYTAVPTNPVAQASSSGSGTGATFTLMWNTSGDFVYGTDDSPAIAAAITDLNTNYQAKGHPVAIYFPGGVYLVRNTPLPVFTGTAGILGDGEWRSIIRIDAPYVGNVFSWDLAFNNSGEFNGNVQGTLSQQAGPEVRSLAVYGDRSAPAQQHAFVFYDRTSNVRMSDLFIDHLRGRALWFGNTLNAPYAYVRESQFDNISVFNCGDVNTPAVDFEWTTGDESNNELDFNTINIYSPYGPGFVLSTAAFVRLNGLRVEGLEYNGPSIAGDLIQLGSTTNGGIMASSFHNVQALSSYLGYASLHMLSPAGQNYSYGNYISASLGGSGYNPGRGLWIGAGRDNRYDITGIASNDYNIVVDGTTSVGGGNIINYPPWSPALTTLINSGSSSYVSAFALGSSTGQLNVGAGNTVGSGSLITDGTGNINTAATSAVFGTSNQVSAGGSAVFGSGNSNTTGSNQTVSGHQITTTGSVVAVFGQKANDHGREGWLGFAPAQTAILGDGQVGWQPLGIQTSGATPARLTSDRGAAGSANTLNLPNNSTIGFQRVVMVAFDPVNIKSCTWYVDNLLVRRGATAATTALVVAPTITQMACDSSLSTASLAVTADTANGGVNFTVTGIASTNLRTNASGMGVEVE